MQIQASSPAIHADAHRVLVFEGQQVSVSPE